MIQGQQVEIKFTTENCLPSRSIDVGTEARKHLTEMKAEKSQYGTYQTLCLEIKKLMEASAAHVMKKVPQSNVLLKNLCCSSPSLSLFLSSLVCIHLGYLRTVISSID